MSNNKFHRLGLMCLNRECSKCFFIWNTGFYFEGKVSKPDVCVFLDCADFTVMQMETST